MDFLIFFFGGSGFVSLEWVDSGSTSSVAEGGRTKGEVEGFAVGDGIAIG